MHIQNRALLFRRRCRFQHRIPRNQNSTCFLCPWLRVSHHLVTWKVAEQQPALVSPRPSVSSVPRSPPPAGSLATITTPPPYYLSRHANPSTRNYSPPRSYSTATPTNSQSAALTSSPVESLSPSTGTTTVTQSFVPGASPGSSTYLAQPVASATPAPAPCRIVNVAARDFLNLRSGPGEAYRSVGRIRPTTRGIVLGSGRYENGSTVWREISVGGYTGWVNEIYLEAESPAQ